jgi:hypothetical protein
MFICICFGEDWGIGDPDDFFDGEAWVFGIVIPGMMPALGFLATRRFLVLLAAAFRRRFGLGFPIFIPGILCMS